MRREEANVSSGIRICHICSYYNNVLFHTLVSAQKAFSEPTVFFFKPVLAGLSDVERSRVVGERIIDAASEAPIQESYHL